MTRVQVRLPARSQNYEIKIGAGLLSTLGREARLCLGSAARRVAVISNELVFDLYGERAVRSLRAAGFTVGHWLMKDGERNKSLRSLEAALAFLRASGLERSDAVIALGGGVVGDLAGFAAAIYLRGIAFIQVPTTLLAQIDASVGGKTAVNTFAGKNLIGAFHQPRLVLIDTETLRTLPRRELTAGWCEAVKQGAAGSHKLFKQTVGFLRSCGTDFSLCASKKESQTEVCATIAAQCRFKASIVARDERENINRTDHRSRRILNFGHTTAHALESITGFSRFRHGEAVGHGMLVAAQISKSLGILAPGELESLREAIRLCGPLPRADDLAIDKIAQAMKSDKKSVGGSMKWVLLERIGRARIVDGSEISPRLLRSALRAGLGSLSSRVPPLAGEG
ncbi:MAG TPA: 3-dehydroquinate synthase [Pyrinomonadaceae bacterium]|nr:3-dehydroquinate synthase [Pyrinomonadaceae bacterium]